MKLQKKKKKSTNKRYINKNQIRRKLLQLNDINIPLIAKLTTTAQKIYTDKRNKKFATITTITIKPQWN